jgi:hypothetical protein
MQGLILAGRLGDPADEASRRQAVSWAGWGWRRAAGDAPENLGGGVFETAGDWRFAGGETKKHLRAAIWLSSWALRVAGDSFRDPMLRQSFT